MRRAALLLCALLLAGSARAIPLAPGQLIVTDPNQFNVYQIDPEAPPDETGSQIVGGWGVEILFFQGWLWSPRDVAASGDRVFVSADLTGLDCSDPQSCEPTAEQATAIVSIDPLTDTGSILFSLPDTGPASPRVGAVVLDPGGDLVVSTTTGVLRLDPVTGATLDTLAAFPWTFGPGGEAYAASWDPSTDTTRFLLIDPETGQETLLATLTAPAGGSAGLGGFAVEPGGDFIAAAPVYYSEMDFLGAVVRIDRQTGAVDVLCALPEGTNCPSPSDVVIGPDGDAYVTDFNGSGIRRIDLVSGGISGVAADTDSPSSIAVVPAPAPPPLALVALAFAALGVRGLRSVRAARHP